MVQAENWSEMTGNSKKNQCTYRYVINMELQTNGVIQVYLFSFLFSKNVLNNDHLPGIMLLDMRETAVKRFKYPALLKFSF